MVNVNCKGLITIGHANSNYVQYLENNPATHTIRVKWIQTLFPEYGLISGFYLVEPKSCTAKFESANVFQ